MDRPYERNRMPQGASFDGMITADAYLWAKYIDDEKLQSGLKRLPRTTSITRGVITGQSDLTALSRIHLSLKMLR